MRLENRAQHWANVYQTKQPTEVSWYRPHLERSLDLIARAAQNLDAAIVDVGGGASTLGDDLVEGGYRHVTVVDVSSQALDMARSRLGERGRDVKWVVADITTPTVDRERFDVWHDRAVFHFLVGESDRSSYRARLAETLKPGGSAIIATFAMDGPPRCSGLPVVRYSAESLAAEFGPDFSLVDTFNEIHQTPAGGTQAFCYVWFRHSSQWDSSIPRLLMIADRARAGFDRP